QKKFSGKIALLSPSKNQWQFYFFEGKLTWIDGGVHSNRIWLRHIIKYFSEINIDTMKFSPEEKYQCHQYQIIKTILQKKLIDREQAQKMIASRTQEIFCDIFYEENQRKLAIKIIPMTPQQLLAAGFEPSLVITNIKELLQESQQSYVSFIQQGGVSFSFNYAPFITNKEALKHEVPPHIYENFVQYFNGQNTIKNVAFKLDKDLTKLALSIIPYLKTNTIKLGQIEDLPSYVTVDKYFSNSHPTQVAVKKTAIACIDDSPLICKMMNTIVNKAGHQFIGINEPLQAIPQLIRAKPTLIFVDLAMPVINGYELCNQIKKISQLKETPVVMLTGRDFMAERVKAKVMGISDFIGKPIVEEKIMNAIEKYAK
ncbi:response regulator, partial [Hyella patelloides]|uniref:response regulator n=1 Tax=Hyella patelloides TaxID=1982969 RepID=UPI001C987083